MSTGGSETSLAVVEEVFRWFNNLGARKISLNRSDLDQHFTTDVTMTINEKVMCKGVDAMFQRFVEMLDKTESWHVAVPFETGLSEADLAAASYQYRFVDARKSRGTAHVIAIWRVRGGKISEIQEMAHFEEQELVLHQY